MQSFYLPPFGVLGVLVLATASGCYLYIASRIATASGAGVLGADVLAVLVPGCWVPLVLGAGVLGAVFIARRNSRWASTDSRSSRCATLAACLHGNAGCSPFAGANDTQSHVRK